MLGTPDSLSQYARGIAMTLGPHEPMSEGQVWDRSRLYVLAGSLALLSGAFLSGCVGLIDGLWATAFRTKIEDISKLSADKIQQVRDVKLVSLDTNSAHTSKGKIVGLACKWSRWPTRWYPRLSESNGGTPEE